MTTDARARWGTRLLLAHATLALTAAAQEPDTHSHGASAPLLGGDLNPVATVFGNFVASGSDNGDDLTRNRFSLREVEIHLGADLASFARGVVVLTIGEELEIENGSAEANSEVGIEEGYLRLRDVDHGLEAKVGQFRSVFGRINRLHTHALPQVTRPLALTNFLGPEGLSAVGVSGAWTSDPDPRSGWTFAAEILNADGGEESPVLGGPNAENPAVAARAAWALAPSDHCHFEVGTSYLFGRTSERRSAQGHTLGADALLEWRRADDPDHVLARIQAEAFAGRYDVEGAGGAFTNDASGGYAFFELLPVPHWTVGVRGDVASFPSIDERNFTDRDWAVSAYVGVEINEHLRLRCEFQHIRSKADDQWSSQNDVFFEVTYSLGSHSH